MSRLALDSILDEYRAQRRYREAKRNQYLRRFEVLRQNHSHLHQHYPSHIVSSHEAHHHIAQEQHTEPRHQVPAASFAPPERQQHPHSHHSHSHENNHPHNHQHHDHQHSHQHENHHHPEPQNLQQRRLEEEEIELLKENDGLKKNLVAIEVEERDRLQTFKAQIETVRNKYLDEIKKLSQTAKISKEQIESKMIKIKQQNEAASHKNAEIQQTNKLLKTQIGEGNALMGQYATEIKKEYAEKIGEFEKIFNSSNEKIEAMEKQFNEDEFIENTLKNEELLKSIEENAEKAQEAGKILEDYGTLLEGKKEILSEIRSNIAMKEREIEKMVELEGKMKLIMDKLTSEKKIYVTENNKMAEELLQIKNLLVGVMNEAK